MEKRKQSRRDLIQNVLISFLTVTAVLLFAQSQLYSLGISAGSSYLSRFTGRSAAAEAALPSSPLMVAPVQVVVSSAYGRYGNVALTTGDQEFEPLGTLLSEVLGSARTMGSSSRQDFLAALTHGSSIYYDFGAPLPLSVLASFMGISLSSENISARRLIVSADNDNVVLYLWDNDETYLHCSTAVTPETLQRTVNHYEMGNAAFAMDDPLPGSEALSPLTLFPKDADPPALPVLNAVSSIASTDYLLSCLNFNPRTNLRYLDPDGTEVIVEGERSVRIGNNGHILYQSGGESILKLSASDQTPPVQEAAANANLLLRTILELDDSAVSLYLSAAQQEDDTTVLRFDYHIDGVPIYFSDGAPAAEITLTGSTVSQLSLRFRQYTSSGQPSLLLPQEQAVAVAALQKDAELSIGYQDRGSETVSAQWLNV